MSKALKTTFMVHTIVALLFGLPMLFIPGRLLGALGWAPIDPIVSRLLGAAMIALSWSSYRAAGLGDKLPKIGQKLLVELEAVYCALGAIGLLRHTLAAYYTWIVWLPAIVLILFAAAWVYFLIKLRP
jgi:hypothetical protein